MLGLDPHVLTGMLQAPKRLCERRDADEEGRGCEYFDAMVYMPTLNSKSLPVLVVGDTRDEAFPAFPETNFRGFSLDPVDAKIADALDQASRRVLEKLDISTGTAGALHNVLKLVPAVPPEMDTTSADSMLSLPVLLMVDSVLRDEDFAHRVPLSEIVSSIKAANGPYATNELAGKRIEELAAHVDNLRQAVLRATVWHSETRMVGRDEVARVVARISTDVYEDPPGQIMGAPPTSPIEDDGEVGDSD